LIYTAFTERLELVFSNDARALSVRDTRPDAPSNAAVLARPGMAAALYLRGVPIFHAGAVVIDGGAVVILGSAGAGKSSLVAALVSAGTAFLSEEVVALDPASPGFAVRPGYPRLSIDRRAAAVVVPDGIPMRPASDAPEKLDVDADRLAGGAHAYSAPLRSVYVLGPWGGPLDDAVIVTRRSRRAVHALLPHMYGARWWGAESPGRHLSTCAAIASSAAIYDVRVPADLDRLNEVADTIIAHAARG
jgi:hypothetical protein